MNALTYSRYGSPAVLRISDVPRPRPGPGDVLVQVHASAVNTGDWRIRAAAFPGITALPGRLMFGLLRPRNPRLGTEFSGIVVAVGDDVHQFHVAQPVYGMTTEGGASAEYLSIGADKAIATLPDGLSFEEAAALPFGGLAALVFLRDFGRLAPGQGVLIVGASGGVGSYAVQIAKAMGAAVTGVAGPDSQAFVKGLGADVAVDYRGFALTDIGTRFDLILDTFGSVSPATAWSLLKPGGLFLPLNFGMRELLATLLNPVRDKKIRLGVNADTAEDLDTLAQFVGDGNLRPVIDSVFDLEEAALAHKRVEARHKRGAIILRVHHLIPKDARLDRDETAD